MPELPEVEVVRRGLVELIVGQTVKNIYAIESPKSLPVTQSDINNFIKKAKITDINRRGKLLIIYLSSGYCLIIHLKMTGQLVYRSSAGAKKFGAGHPNDSLIGQLPDRSTRVVLELDDGTLYFNDQRKFGWINLKPKDLLDEIKLYKTMGPEPFESTEHDFIRNIKKRVNSKIKPAILDQAVIAGVGNIYADESLWMSRIHPESKVKDIGETRLKKLFLSVVEVMQLSIAHGGSTDRNYVNAKGQRGSYLKFAQVFRRDNEPCPRCGTIIKKIKVAGRGTHFCPKCQVMDE